MQLLAWGRLGGRALSVVPLILAGWGCSSPTSKIESEGDHLVFNYADQVLSDQYTPDVELFDKVTDKVEKEQSIPEISQEELEELGEGDLVQVCSGPGEFLCPCEKNGDCVSGYCIESEEGKVCTKSCVDDCPSGWACLQDTKALPDMVYICLPQHVYICRPCNSDEECHSPYANEGNLCVSHGDNGSFCGEDCSVNGECPDGYVCAEVPGGNGTMANQCVPTGGECVCSPLAVKQGAWTKCKKVNGYGECLGERKCLPDGLSECSAMTPEPEKCNGIDDNCDGVIDPVNSLNCTMYYEDNDGDGFGIGAGTCECKPPSPKHVSVGGDCNDASTGINPSVKEACNYIDDDCDGETDESFAEGCQTLYYDADGDGWGDESKTDCLCHESKEWTKVAGDCNPDNPDTHPEAMELCDGEDNNCDGVIDEEDAVGCIPYYLDQDKDGYGLSDQLKCLCEKLGDYTATKGGDCDDTLYNVHPTVAELCDGLDNDCDGEIDEGEAVLTCGVVPHASVECKGGCVISECEAGYYDLNEAFADGCECQVEPGEVPNQQCVDAEYVGDLGDGGSSTSRSGKIVPGDDSDWYKFNAVDGVDPEGCDTFHVRVRLLKNPNDAYQFDVYMKGCAGADNLCAGSTEFEYFTDFHVDTTQPGDVGGECKCAPDADHNLTPTDYSDDTDATTHQCVSQSNEFFIRVYRKPGAPVLCDEYQIEFSNGIKL